MEISTTDERVNFGWSHVDLVGITVHYFTSFLSLPSHSVCYLFMCAIFLWHFISIFSSCVWNSSDSLKFHCLLFDNHRSSILSHVKSQWSTAPGLWASFSLLASILMYRWLWFIFGVAGERRSVEPLQRTPGCSAGDSPTSSLTTEGPLFSDRISKNSCETGECKQRFSNYVV